MAFASPKSRTFHVSGCGELDIGRLEIAMHDAAVVRVLECVGDLRGHRQRFVERDWSAGDAIGQCWTFDELHHERAQRFMIPGRRLRTFHP
jgi:hypothetical protein